MISPSDVRNRWSQRLFVKLCHFANVPPWDSKIRSIDEVLTSEWSAEHLIEMFYRFVQEMRNRCEFGRYRYGPVREDPLNFMLRLRHKLDEYDRTGNMDLLADISNYAMFERVVPQNPKAHWPEEFESGNLERYIKNAG